MKSPCVQVGRGPALGLPGAADLGEETEHVGHGGGGRLERLLAQQQVSWRPSPTLPLAQDDFGWRYFCSIVNPYIGDQIRGTFRPQHLPLYLVVLF